MTLLKLRNLHGPTVGWLLAWTWLLSTPTWGWSQDVMAVPAVRPQRTTLIRSTHQPATLHAFFEADLHAKVAGYLDQLHVDIGDRVAAGTTLAVIQVPEMQKSVDRQAAQVQRWKAEQQRAVAHHKLAVAGLEAARALHTQAEAEVQKAVAQLAADQLEFERVEQLVARQAVAGKVRDEIAKRRDASQAARAAAEAAAVSAKAQVTVAAEQVAVAESDVDAAKAQTLVAETELEELAVLLEYATIKAPFAGVVTRRNVSPGDLVRNTQNSAEAPRKPLFVMSKIDRLRVHVAVPEDAAPFVDVGDAMTLKLRAFPQHPRTGQVARTSGDIDPTTRTMLVEIELNNDDGQLLPGMYGEATLTLESVADALVLPAGAVRHTEQGQSYVYVIQADDTIRRVDVQPGLDDGKQIQIVAGLKGDERLVDAMIGRLADGQKVRVLEKK